MDIQHGETADYIRPEERILKVANDKNEINWKSFLYQLIHDENLDPWDIDLGILTQKYLEVMRDLKEVDFDSSGKFLTIAVFLLKTKAENLVEQDLRGIEEQIAQAQRSDDSTEEIESLEEIDSHLEDISDFKKKERYTIKVRNPIARKRKVNIFDLVKLLENTFKQSNRRRENFFYRNHKWEYEGPIFEKKKKDLKEIISELHDLIVCEWKSKKGHITFGYVSKNAKSKMELLHIFMPLLHLHNQNKVYLKQKGHFGDIEIHNVEDSN